MSQGLEEFSFESTELLSLLHQDTHLYRIAHFNIYASLQRLIGLFQFVNESFVLTLFLPPFSLVLIGGAIFQETLPGLCFAQE